MKKNLKSLNSANKTIKIIVKKKCQFKIDSSHIYNQPSILED